MSTTRPWPVGILIVALLLAAPTDMARADQGGFTLARFVPDDVFLYAAERHNPERDFLRDYWGTVFEVLAQSGVDEDVIELFGSLLYREQPEQVERLKRRISELLAGVDWHDLVGHEFAFVERLAPPEYRGPGAPPFLMADMVWLFRGSPAGAARNYEGLVAIQQAFVDEINRALGIDALRLERSERHGAQLARLDLLGSLPGAPSIPISIARRDDLVLIALRDELRDDVLALLAGVGSKRALEDNPRFRQALAELPPPEDELVYFDMQALLKPLDALLEITAAMAATPEDTYFNTAMSSEVRRLNSRALRAYRRGQIEEALARVQEAHELDPDNSIVLYNLSCFHALLGHREQALDWLEKAVEGGFYGPMKIASDSDLESLRAEPRYQAALARARELAARYGAEDIVINASKQGEAYKLLLQASEAYKQQDYEQGLRLVEQAYALAPQDSRVLYHLACFHALLGHREKGLDFLERAVAGGFCCPTHIAKDPDLESLRDSERYRQVLEEARRRAGELTARQTADRVGVIRRLFQRLTEALGVLDYAVTVATTDGYSTWTESVSVVVPDAPQRAIYPIFARRPVADFDRFLPQETVSFSVSNQLDLAALHEFVIDSFETAGTPGKGLLDRWDDLQQKLGFDLRRDVLDWLAGEFISVTLSEGRGSVWMIRVSDEQLAREKVSAAIEFLSTRLTAKLGELAAENPALGMLAMFGVHTSPATHEQLEGFENLHFTISPQPAVWGVAEGYLIFASSADAAALCLATARGEHPNIRSNPRAMSEMIVPSGPTVSVTLTDQRDLGQKYAKGLGIASMITSMLSGFVPEPRVRPIFAKIGTVLSKLTAAARRVDFYKSTATHTTFDGRRWRTRTVTHYVSPEERGAGKATGVSSEPL